jgi:hypothetical protein
MARKVRVRDDALSSQFLVLVLRGQSQSSEQVSVSIIC